ncbi:hypothetical protein CQ010_01380 [Arthrobacter sp. MYb211]|uniref:hypothetical protein n=1 Tax=unclassified Arthrobacter TaxID=235627 RepID=UPI000CFC202C|nr:MULTISPECIES: hypothetical protein [unclassified Arthrobacter]PRA13326.1 hypothetical protein CQ015_03635 [Arthrobacter sp. MYb221]PRC10523.1 hypothetical protein CQ010_01380 [Arthrobacter sp. MYb211]
MSTNDRVEAVRQALQALINETANEPLMVTGWVGCVNVVSERGNYVLKASPAEQPRAMDYGLVSLVRRSERIQMFGQSPVDDEDDD